MKASDSRECRNCHSFKGMPEESQAAMAWLRHKDAQKKGETCIDCHKGMKKEEE